ADHRAHEGGREAVADAVGFTAQALIQRELDQGAWWHVVTCADHHRPRNRSGGWSCRVALNRRLSATPRYGRGEQSHTPNNPSFHTYERASVRCRLQVLHVVSSGRSGDAASKTAALEALCEGGVRAVDAVGLHVPAPVVAGVATGRLERPSHFVIELPALGGADARIGDGPGDQGDDLAHASFAPQALDALH